VPTLQTKPGTRKLSEAARLVVAPTGISSTSWPSVRDTCTKKLGITFDDWQEATGRLILAKRDDGNLAAMVDGVGLSLPRQVGKTYLMAALLFALCINRPGLLVIWSAHHARTHGETFLSMQGFADRSKVKPYIRQVFTGSGDEEVRFLNGSRILFGARERGFGRGIPGVDVLVFDEAQILSDRALANMLATMNTSQFGLALFIGTPPRPEDRSEVFERMRADARSGRLKDGAWVEFGADPDGDDEDRKQWRKANPSYPRRTPEESMLRLKRKLTAEDWSREGLGKWDEIATAGTFAAAWRHCVVDLPAETPHPRAIGVAVSVDREWSSIAMSTAGPTKHLGSVDRRAGVGWLVSEVARIQETYDCAVILDSKGPAASLLDDLKDAGVTVRATTSSEYLDACADLYDAAIEGEVHHANYDDLNAAVLAAKKRSVGDRWAWGRKSGDISMLEAATLATWGVDNAISSFNVW
jgi:hypothetical protein